jgi:uncharacterized small protein (TIGR04563 family)
VKNAKRTVYFPAAMIAEIEAEALRLNVSVREIMVTAWRMARDSVRSYRFGTPPAELAANMREEIAAAARPTSFQALPPAPAPARYPIGGLPP